MRNQIHILLLFLAVLGIIITSCHKTKHSTPSTTVSSISGLTAMRHMTYVDTGTVNLLLPITWNFSGTNPVLAIPNIDSTYLGHQELTFTGTNMTQVSYYNSNPQGYYLPLTINFTYSPANLIDTITLQYAFTVFGAEKIVLQYNGTQLSEAIVAHTNPPVDTFYWSQSDIYYFTYTGNNISQIILSRYDGTSGRYNTTVNYFMDNRSNNFAGSMATFFQLEFLEESTASIDGFLLDLPTYTNANFVDSIYNGTAGSQFIITTDAAGRITRRIGGTDTTFYYY